MARRVFFSFHYDNDITRVSRIRNSGALKSDAQPFLDKAEWEQVKRKGDKSIENWIDRQMSGTSVVIVCVGEETHNRKWVRHEIKKAYEEGRGLLGIYLTGMKDLKGTPSVKGHNPLDDFYEDENGNKKLLSEIFPVYSWINDDGYNKIQNWIEEAAEIVGR